MPKIRQNPRYPSEITTNTGGVSNTNMSSNISAENDDDESSPRENNTIGTSSHQDRWSEEAVARAIEVWSLSKEEEQYLRRLKERLSDIDHPKSNPHDLVKFIKGPQGPDKAEEVFRNMIKWRREFGTDNLLDNYKPPHVLYNYVSTAMLKGVDHDGDPVYVERAGAVDGLGLVRRFDRETLLKHTVWLRELTASGVWREDFEREHGHQPRQLTIVYDLEGLSSRHCKKEVIPIFKELVSYTADKYYGVSKRMIIIRAPAIFRMVWRIAKNFYAPEVQKKMIFAGKNYLDVIDQYMNRDILPSCINPQGHGKTARGFPPNLNGGMIPENVEEDDNTSNTSSTQMTYHRSSYSFDSSCDDDVMEEESTAAAASASRVSVSCRTLLKGSLKGDNNVTTTLERI